MASNPRFAANNSNRDASREARERIANRRTLPGGSLLRPVEDGASRRYIDRSRSARANGVGNQPVDPARNAKDVDHAKRDQRRQSKG